MSRTTRAGGWSKEKPTATGWYWWRRYPEYAPEIVYISFDSPEEIYELRDDGKREELRIGEWQPVQEPRE